MRRSLVPVLALVLVGGSLTGCGLFGGSSSLDDALEVVPGSASRVIFFDRAAAMERLDVDEIDSDSSDEEIDEYVDAVLELPWSTELDRYLLTMLDDAPFTAQDVDWEVISYDNDSGFGRVWRMNDDLDLDDVVDDLKELGFEEEGSDDDATMLRIDLEDVGEDQTYLTPLLDVTIVPDEHLVITGPLAEDVAEVVADDADSAVDTDAFADLVDSTDDVELADLARDDLACSMGATRLTQEQLAASGLDELGHPEEVGFFVHGDEADTRSVLQFDSDEAAEDDAAAREEFLDEGSSPVAGVPYSEFGSWKIEADGDQVRIDIDYDDPRDVPAVVSRGDYLSVCLPE
ncbi:MAG TPA: hypothetical protein VFO49_20920 [Nocardioides sp.]|nr:hypothetical protein [Nocardioides sp.]